MNKHRRAKKGLCKNIRDCSVHFFACAFGFVCSESGTRLVTPFLDDSPYFDATKAVALVLPPLG